MEKPVASRFEGSLDALNTMKPHPYSPPCIEQVLAAEDLEREVAYAGIINSIVN